MRRSTGEAYGNCTMERMAKNLPQGARPRRRITRTGVGNHDEDVPIIDDRKGTARPRAAVVRTPANSRGQVACDSMAASYSIQHRERHRRLWLAAGFVESVTRVVREL